jgi:hypothetical protein
LIGVLPYYWRPKCKCIGAHAPPYAFMVSGLFVPAWCFIFEEKPSHHASGWVALRGTTPYWLLPKINYL